MPWRIITPSDVHDTFLNESPEPKPGKRRKNARRKKSSKSEPEHDVPTSDQPVQDTQAEEGLAEYLIVNNDADSPLSEIPLFVLLSL